MTTVKELQEMYQDLMEQYRKAKASGDYDTALTFFEQAQQVCNSTSIAESLLKTSTRGE